MDEAQDRRDPGLSRRRLLRLGAVAAGAVALGVPAGLAVGRGHPAGASVPAAAATTPPTSTPLVLQSGGFGEAVPPIRATPHIASHRPPALSEPVHVHTWDHPIRRLDDIVARSPRTAFPRNAIMLTIDDGPHPVWTPQYLRLLAKYDVQATFCVIGRQVEQHPDLVRAVVSEGHDVANHTFAHPLNLPRLGTRRIRHELGDTTDAIVRATGYRPRQFRAPGGVWGPDVFTEVSRQGMLPLGWDIDPRDWSLPGVAHIRSAMLATRPHDIILCHDGGGDRSQTFEALTTVVPALIARGWRFVSLRGAVIT